MRRRTGLAAAGATGDGMRELRQMAGHVSALAAGLGRRRGGRTDRVGVEAERAGRLLGARLRSGVAAGGPAAGSGGGDLAAVLAPRVLATLLRSGASRVGLQVLARGPVAAALAPALLEAGQLAEAHIRGEISAATLAERLGQTGCTTVAGLGAGAAAGAALGPLGAALGPLVGCLLAARVYQCCLDGFRDPSRGQEARRSALARVARQVMERERRELERRLSTGSAAGSAGLAQVRVRTDRARITDLAAAFRSLA